MLIELASVITRYKYVEAVLVEADVLNTGRRVVKAELQFGSSQQFVVEQINITRGLALPSPRSPTMSR